MWFDAFGFEGRLQVTKCGQARSVDRFVDNYPSGKRLIKGKLLNCSIDKVGYKRVDLRKRSKSGVGGRSMLLHRIIATTFIENKNDLPVVNHIDGDKLNNSIENLEWCTVEYNHKHAWSTGLCDGTKKPVICCNESGFGLWLPHMHSASWARASLIHAAIHGRQKTHRGMTWDYCEYQTLKNKQVI